MNKEITRDEVQEKYKWDLTPIYKDEEEFNNDKDKALKLIEELDNYKGRITENSETLYNFLKLEEDISVVISNMFLYASCKRDEDLSNSENQKRYNEVVNVDSIYMEKDSFTLPELLKTKYDVIEKYIEENDKLKEFTFDLKEMYRFQKYVLSDKEEVLLSNISELGHKYESNFNIIVDSIMDLGYITLDDGSEVKLTNGNYSKYSRSKSRNVRKQAYLNQKNALKKFANLVSTDYEGNIKTDAMVAKARGYNSNLEMYLYNDGLTPTMYDNMLDIAHKNLNVLHKYYRMIKKISKIDDFKIYDISVPLLDKYDKKYTPEDARRMIVEALSVYGSEYTEILDSAFENRWIDFYPNKGKKSGYYETCVFKGHPVVLGNYNDDFLSVSSICHELGHAMNSYYSFKNNPPHLAQYTILVAEVASITNEVLLSNYIVKHSNDKFEKLEAIKNILEVFASNFFGTLSEGSIFEKIVHDRVYNGEMLTELDFNEIYDKIAKEHYGSDVEVDDLIKYNWVRIPHFYSSFYYYKYSIGVSSALYVANKILNGDEEFLNKYLDYLKLGGTMLPTDELKTIGIDLENPTFMQEAINYFDNLIDEYERIYNS